MGEWNIIVDGVADEAVGVVVVVVVEIDELVRTDVVADAPSSGDEWASEMALGWASAGRRSSSRAFGPGTYTANGPPVSSKPSRLALRVSMAVYMTVTEEGIASAGCDLPRSVSSLRLIGNGGCCGREWGRSFLESMLTVEFTTLSRLF